MGMQQAAATDETPPRPDTHRAILISAGIHKPTTTVHFYKETRMVTLKDAHGRDYGQWGHFFQCLKTGVERLWGTERTAEDLEMEMN